MKLDSFRTAYDATRFLSLQGESLVCMSNDGLLVFRHVESAVMQIEVTNLDKPHPQAIRFTSETYPMDMKQLEIPVAYVRLLEQS